MSRKGETLDPLTKRQRRVWITAFTGLFFLLALVCWNRRVPSSLNEYVGPMEANHPWLVFDPTLEQDLPSPFADKNDPNILYLIFVQENGLAIKIDLKAKAVSPVRFTSDHGDPTTTIRYKTARTKLEYVNPDDPVWEEFRGTVQKQSIRDTFGHPLDGQPGTRETTLRNGYWYVMDQRKEQKVELLRTKIQNSDLMGNGGLGEAYISPDKKWIVFTLANHPARTFIFSRETTDPETFQ